MFWRFDVLSGTWLHKGAWVVAFLVVQKVKFLWLISTKKGQLNDSKFHAVIFCHFSYSFFNYGLICYKFYTEAQVRTLSF